MFLRGNSLGDATMKYVQSESDILVPKSNVPIELNRTLIDFSLLLISRHTSSTFLIKLASVLRKTYSPSGLRALHSAMIRSADSWERPTM
jgi:hypothetical protein